eukprot:GHVN01106536.1.p1 GENE.GHVN01106536.1~~GHVN01106536.1.p1  ORF type:complete len:1875 (+),score=464.29 GHVN01106536.1:181-5625(+)
MSEAKPIHLMSHSERRRQLKEMRRSEVAKREQGESNLLPSGDSCEVGGGSENDRCGAVDGFGVRASERSDGDGGCREVSKSSSSSAVKATSVTFEDVAQYKVEPLSEDEGGVSPCTPMSSSGLQPQSDNSSVESSPIKHEFIETHSREKQMETENFLSEREGEGSGDELSPPIPRRTSRRTRITSCHQSDDRTSTQRSLPSSVEIRDEEEDDEGDDEGWQPSSQTAARLASSSPEASEDDDEITMAAADLADRGEWSEERQALLGEADMPLEELKRLYCGVSEGSPDGVSEGSPHGGRNRSDRRDSSDSDEENEEDDEYEEEDDDMSEVEERTRKLETEPKVKQSSRVKQEDTPTPSSSNRRDGPVTLAPLNTALSPSNQSHQQREVALEVPHLVRCDLRVYQREGMEWLVRLHDQDLNGVLADEMGLGKTVQTITLLAYLALNRGVWGPHLVVVPTTVMINWEMEFKKWCPGFKIVCYFGNPAERRKKRAGWNTPNAFNVCIASYSVVLQDASVFKRKAWYYLVLDEAQNIKNFKSQRWQTMLHFNTAHRLLLTGTPLQNDLMELWSLMHFLMPRLFESHSDFKSLFNDPLTTAIESSLVAEQRGRIAKLHQCLRPFLLRRLKRDVEKQMPSKYEHVLRCTLSKRQRYLYDEFIEAKTTKTTMKEGDYFSLMNALMQLRKVCNHPDLFEPRSIQTQYWDDEIAVHAELPALVNLWLHEPMCQSADQKMRVPDLSHFTLINYELNSSHLTQRARQWAHSLIATPFLRDDFANDSFDNIQHPGVKRLGEWSETAVCCWDLSDPFTSAAPVTLEALATLPPHSTLNLPGTAGWTDGIIPPSRYQHPSPQSNLTQNKCDLQSYNPSLHQRGQNSEFVGGEYHATGEPDWRRLNTQQTGTFSTGRESMPYTGYDSLHDAQWSGVDTLETRAASPDVSVLIESPAVSIGEPRTSNYITERGDGSDVNISSSQPRLASENFWRHSKFWPSTDLIASSHSLSTYVSGRGNRRCQVGPAVIPTISQCLLRSMDVGGVGDWFDKDASWGPYRRALGKMKGGNWDAVQARGDPNACLEMGGNELDAVSEVDDKNKTMQGDWQGLEPSEVDESVERNEFGDVNLDDGMKDRGTSEGASPPSPSTLLPVRRATRQSIQAELIEASRQHMTQTGAFNCEWVPIERVDSVKDWRGSKIFRELHQARATAALRRRSERWTAEWLNHQKIVLTSDVAPVWGADLRQWLQREVRKPFKRSTRCRIEEEGASISLPLICETRGDKRQYVPRARLCWAWPRSGGDILATDNILIPPRTGMDYLCYSSTLRSMCPTPNDSLDMMMPIITHFTCIVPHKVKPEGPRVWLRGGTGVVDSRASVEVKSPVRNELEIAVQQFQPIISLQSCLFPPATSLQDDCGKLIVLSRLLKKLRAEDHKAVIFTQMSKMLDVLEMFINLHGFTYVRLDGGIKVEMRQKLVQRFNQNHRVFLFISSTRAGGVGINLTGADTVIFYDSDWNPAMDRQAMDRCHRIGQTRDVHIYRLISENTIEENMLRKQLQKRQLDDVVVDQGKFNTDYISSNDVREIFVPKASGGVNDLYVTRLLHEQSGDNTDQIALTKGSHVRKAEFEAVLKQVEDSDDFTAMKMNKSEISTENLEFKKDFSQTDKDNGDDNTNIMAIAQDDVKGDSIPANDKTPSDSPLSSTANDKPQNDSPNNLSEVKEVMKPKRDTQRGKLMMVQVDDTHSLYINGVARYALRLLENVELPSWIEADVEEAQRKLEAKNSSDEDEEEEEKEVTASEWSSQCSTPPQPEGDEEEEDGEGSGNMSEEGDEEE